VNIRADAKGAKLTVGGKAKEVDSQITTCRALWYIGPQLAEIREMRLRSPAPDGALVRMLWSGISRGTERLVFAGEVPASEFARMRAPLQEGDFPFPVKYGYCGVGVVEAGPTEWVGRETFVLHPHQTRFCAPIGMLNPLPAGLPPRRAVLAANMETALNALWDSGCGPGDRVAVVGAGVVGSLIGVLACGMPGVDVTIIDRAQVRRHFAESIGARFLTPLEATGRGLGADVMFHASASAEGLALSLELAGREGTIVELSWYGERRTTVPLGGAFHSQRLRLIASQVGEVAPSRRPRWTHARRLAKALELLGDVRLDALITEEITFAELPAALPRLLAVGAPGIATAVRYEAE
jgi:threonine dehydrogenase-like Zn-dependent dehydrogenase